jgi:endonuclease/exonuclease/phosphatase family metal-dependent hydrolase
MPGTLTLATFNVKDLFEVPPGASRAPLDAKLDNLGGILAQAEADVVALQEVGSLAVVRELAARVPSLGYAEPVMGTVDARGIGCAILARVPILDSCVHTAADLPFPAFFAGDAPPFAGRLPLRRGIVHVRVAAGDLGTVDVFSLHFKSNRGLPLRDSRGEEIPPATSREFAEAHLRSLVWRSAEALFVRGLVDGVLAADATRHVAVAGDFNDHPNSHVLRVVAGGGPLELSPCASIVPEKERFSILRHGAPQQIDHVLASPLLRERLVTARFLNGALRDHGDFREATEPLPDSDHAALVVSFS